MSRAQQVFLVFLGTLVTVVFALMESIKLDIPFVLSLFYVLMVYVVLIIIVIFGVGCAYVYEQLE